MARSTTKVRATTKAAKAPVAGTGRAETHKQPAADQAKTPIERAAELSGEVLSSVEAGQRAALGAVRRFVDTLDESLPAIGDRPSRREKVIDAALDMADRLVTTEYEFLRSVMRSVDRSRSAQGRTKKRESAKRPTAKKPANTKAPATTKRPAKKRPAKG